MVTQGSLVLAGFFGFLDGLFVSFGRDLGASDGLDSLGAFVFSKTLGLGSLLFASTKGALINSISRADSDWEIDLRGMFSRSFRFALIKFLDLAHSALVQHGWQCLTKHGIDFQSMFLSP